MRLVSASSRQLEALVPQLGGASYFLSQSTDLGVDEEEVLSGLSRRIVLSSPQGLYSTGRTKGLKERLLDQFSQAQTYMLSEELCVLPLPMDDLCKP